MQIFKIFLLISVIISVIAVTYSLVRVSKMLWENRKKTYIKLNKEMNRTINMLIISMILLVICTVIYCFCSIY